MPSERTEDYLEALNTIILKKGYAKVKDVSDFLRVSPKKSLSQPAIFYSRTPSFSLRLLLPEM